MNREQMEIEAERLSRILSEILPTHEKTILRVLLEKENN